MKEFKKAGDKVTIEDVYESCKRYITNEDDMKLIKKAYDYIMVKHEGQKRKSGEPYINSFDLGCLYFINITNRTTYHYSGSFTRCHGRL